MLLFTALIMYSSHAQCDRENYTTLSGHYIFSPKGNGGGIEMGITGDVSKLNIHFDADFTSMTLPGNKENIKSVVGTIYTKLGYRIFRIDYLLSGYIDGMVGMDNQKGIFTGMGVQLLHPMGRSAISIEPIYSTTEHFLVQLGIHYMIK